MRPLIRNSERRIKNWSLYGRELLKVSNKEHKMVSSLIYYTSPRCHFLATWIFLLYKNLILNVMQRQLFPKNLNLFKKILRFRKLYSA